MAARGARTFIFALTDPEKADDRKLVRFADSLPQPKGTDADDTEEKDRLRTAFGKVINMLWRNPHQIDNCVQHLENRLYKQSQCVDESVFFKQVPSTLKAFDDDFALQTFQERVDLPRNIVLAAAKKRTTKRCLRSSSI